MTGYLYIGKKGSETDPRITLLSRKLSSGGWTVITGANPADAPGDTDMILSVGGDGSFLSASSYASRRGIPVVGVNLGRLGFLSENRPEDVADALISGEYEIEERGLLSASLSGSGNPESEDFIALNEVTVHRSGAAMLGVDVRIGDEKLPTYWADGLVISTSSGSTAYSLSVGGPIVLPQSKVLIISPIAPHNLNVRPLVVPDSSEITLDMHSRDGQFTFTADNLNVCAPSDISIRVSMAQFSLKRVRLNKSDFINALTEKLFWGEDVRNIK